MALTLNRQLATIVCFLMTYSTASNEICGNYVTYSVTSRRNATGYREVSSDLLAVQDGVAPDVRLELQQKSCVTEGIRRLLIKTFIGLPEPRLPPPGYELVPELGWYRLHLTPLTWEEARQACVAEGAHLAVLNSQEEADALKGIFARAPAQIPGATYHHVAIIGFSDLVEGKFYTIFGETLEQAGYAVWGTDQPNNAKGNKDSESDCGGIERTGKLNDLPCRSVNAYFCEFPL
ncbi:Hemolymph lipopolysaccharide-binding protein [Gryllus bimaculatus]|nr:Hemolymph lipopolysaccharide-binding protein [Gryllus bimaculatus]